jgi:ribosome-binding protein aMBF1 (putative translation factor)
MRAASSIQSQGTTRIRNFSRDSGFPLAKTRTTLSPLEIRMPQEDSTSFGQLLKQRRLLRGLTQEMLAESSGLGIRSIQGLERGESQPRRETLRRLAEALKL